MTAKSDLDGTHSPSLQITLTIDVPSGKRCPVAQVIVHVVESQDRLELLGSGGGVIHSFFSCSQYGPTKLSGQTHSPGTIHIPLFLQGGTHIAIKDNNV